MESKEKVDHQRLCGGCGHYPAFLKRFANPRYFLLTFCLQNVIQGASTSYFVGVETSLEKHFHFSSKDFGLLIVLAEIGPITTSLILSYLGGKGNRPRWLCAGMTITAVGLLITFSTFFIYPPPDISESGKLSHSKKYCSVKQQFNNVTDPPSDPQQSDGGVDPCYESNSFVFFVWFISYSCLGVGGMVVYSIGGPYLDDGISKNDSPLYFAIIIAVKIMGPFVGFAVSAGFLKIYVLPGENHGISSLDPRWIGAWWGGTLLFSFLNLVVGSIICLFPRDMSIVRPVLKKDHLTSSSVSSSHITGSVDYSEYGTIENSKDDTLKTNDVQHLVADKEEKPIYEDFASSLKRLAKNKTLVLTAVTDVFAVTGIIGFFLWLPKYLEHQFRIDKSESALYTGLAGTSSVIIGVLGGGILIRQCQPSARTLVILCASCKAIYIVSLVGMMFISCNFNDDLPGYYDNNSRTLNVTFPCSMLCSCDLKEFIPVCLKDEQSANSQTFFSPCHAGCPVSKSANNAEKRLVPHLQEKFSNCLCSPPSSSVTLGYCEKTCSMFTVYNLVNVVIKSFISVGAIGNLLLNLRCVDPKDKAIALGLKGTMIALGLLIAPLVFGALADSSCILWEEACGTTGSCWVYDTQDFGYKLHGGSLCLFFLSLICDIVLSRNVGHVILTDGPLHGWSGNPSVGGTTLDGTSTSNISLNSNSLEPSVNGIISSSQNGSLRRSILESNLGPATPNIPLDDNIENRQR